MEALKEYLLYNWGLILILMAFIIMLIITVFLNKKTIMRMYLLIGAVFILSIVVFLEFYLGDINKYPNFRIVLTSVRYSATPLIISIILYTIVKKKYWYVLLPAIILTIINFVSIFTGIVFSIDDNGSLKRGILGYLPYIGVGFYSFLLIYVLIRKTNKQVTEIIPIIFIAFVLITGLFFPFIIGKEYSKIFSTSIAIALFVYYVFLILQLTKKDSLTGLLNRQAYYAAIRDKAKDITAIVSIDMNGLKKINDTYGHQAGDDAIFAMAECLFKATKSRQLAFRTGGDEFIIICIKINEDDLKDLILRINKNVSSTKYSCSIGYCFDSSQNKDIEDMVKKSDELMYEDKAKYYSMNCIK